MKFFSLIFLFLLVFSSVFCQDKKIKFGKINPEDLAMKSYEADLEASALVLSDIGLIQLDPHGASHNVTRFHHVVLKILNKRGAEQHGNISIPYYKYSRGTYITNLRANVHLPDGTVIKLRPDQFLDEDINEYYGQKKIAFPSVVEGAILEYDYQLSSNDFFTPVDWLFQREIPIRYSELVVRIPNWFDYVILTQGQRLLENSKTQEGSPSSDVVYTKWTYINKDVPALREEKYITTMKDYYSRVRFRLNSFQPPRSLRQNILNTWTEVAEALWSMPAFGYQLNNKRPGELVLEAAGVSPADTGTQLNKAIRVYSYLNRNIQLEKWSSIGSNMEIQEILKKRIGTGGQLNKLMLAALLQLGIEAYPVLISSREHGRSFELYPFIDQFDHMVVMAKPDGVETWIDVGHIKRPLGQLASQSLNSRGWVAKKKDPYWIDIPQVESKTILLIKGQLTEDGHFQGEMEARFTGFHALQQRESYERDREKYFTTYLTYSQSFAPVSEIEFMHVTEYDKPFQIKGKINSIPLGTAGSTKIYLPPLLFGELIELPFKQEKRSYFVEYNYSEDYTVITEIIIPQDYTVEHLPASAKYVSEGNGIQLSLQASTSQHKINLISKFAVKQLVFTPEDYPMLKNLYDVRKELFSEQIVVKKNQ